MAATWQEFIRRDCLHIQGQAATNSEAIYQETSEAREAYLTGQHVLEEMGQVLLRRQLAKPELDKNAMDARPDGLFDMGALDDGCTVSDQDRTSSEDLAIEVGNALTARGRRWAQLVPVGPSGRPVAASSSKPASAAMSLTVEAEALMAANKATAAHMELAERMQRAVVDGILQQQDRLDKTEFMVCASRAKAAILKLQSLERHFMVAAYRKENLMALDKILAELRRRSAELQEELTQANKQLAAYRSLGPAFHEQLARLRDVQHRLLDTQYMLENFKKLDSELQQDPYKMDEDPYGDMMY